MRPIRLAAGPLLAAALLVGVAACGDDGPPGALADLLEVVPAEAAERGLFYSSVDADGPGFGSVLPLEGAEVLFGIEPDALTDVLETGGAPLTALAGSVDADDLAETVETRGYRLERTGDWTVFTRGPTTGGPLAAAVPAGAVRDGLLVLGDPEEVRAGVRGTEPAAAERGVPTLVAELGDATAAALLTAPDALRRAAEAHGGVTAALERAGASGDLPAWDASALVWEPRDDNDDDGAVLLAFDRPVDGHEAARALVLRAATAPVLDAGPTADLFERGAPRWDPEAGVVRLPVGWGDVAPPRVRPHVERGELLFLAPSEP